jgi:hypothetical protein
VDSSVCVCVCLSVCVCVCSSSSSELQNIVTHCIKEPKKSDHQSKNLSIVTSHKIVKTGVRSWIGLIDYLIDDLIM